MFFGTQCSNEFWTIVTRLASGDDCSEEKKESVFQEDVSEQTDFASDSRVQTSTAMEISPSVEAHTCRCLVTGNSISVGRSEDVYDKTEQLTASLTDCVIYVAVAGRWSLAVNDLFFTSLPAGRSLCSRLLGRMLPVNHRQVTVRSLVPTVIDLTMTKATFLSASLYFSKIGAYWDRLCRDVVGRWLVGCHARALWPNDAS